MRLNLLTLIILGFFIMGVLVYNFIGSIFGNIGMGRPFVCMATSFIMLGVVMVALVIYAIYKGSNEKDARLQQRINKIRPRPCPQCRAPMTYHKEYGYYCEKCLRYFNS